METIELSHAVRDGMPTCPGLPAPRIGLHVDHAASRADYDGQAEFAIGRFDLVGNVGTYLDSPYHRDRGAADIAQLALEHLVDLPTVLVDARRVARRHRRLDLVLPVGPLSRRAVLVRTGWDDRWGTDAYWEPGPFLGAATVEQLVHRRPALLGVDFWNVDDPNDPARPTHTALLRAGIPIVEHLRGLGRVTAAARTFVVPLAIVGAPSVPVRAFALLPPGSGRSAPAGRP